MSAPTLPVKLPPFTVEAFFSAQEAAETIPWHIADYAFRELWEPIPTGAGTRGKFLSGPDAGKPVVVGIVDTGAPKDHPDLDGAIREAKDFSGSLSGPFDVQGHGTHVGGIVAARYGNGLGITGAAPDAQLVYAKGLDDNGTGSDAGIAAAIDWLVGRGDISVINLSLGSDMHSPAIQQACDRAAAAKVPIVAAAGNSGGRINCPGNLPTVICVGAVDRQRHVAPFSCRGPEMDIAAPGVDILSSFVNGTYAKLSGTSMAAPWVAAVVALMIAADPTIDRSLEAIFSRIKKAAVDEGDPGHDYYFGWGLVNPAKAVAVPLPPVQGPPASGGGTVPVPGSPADQCGCVLRGLAKLIGA